MKAALRLTACLVLITLLTLAGCVELEGQRLCLSYDEKTDTLKLLLFYDGIHEATDKGYAEEKGGVQQIPDFVAKGNIMLLDWYGQINVTDLKGADANDAWGDLSRALAGSLKTQPVGYYRDGNGHVGAAQLIVITHAKALIQKLNAYINAEVAARMSSSFGDEMARTAKLCQAAAAKNHEWFTLDGQALRLTFPIHPGEWRAAKAKGLWSIVKGIQLGSKSGEVRAEMLQTIRSAVTFLATSAVSYEESDGEVSIQLGNRRLPNVFRVPVHDEYEPSLEPVVEKSVPTDLSDALARFILGHTDKPAPGVSEVIAFGPPEAIPAALTQAATSNDESLHDAAMAKLGAWAKQWNESQAVPAAPEAFDAQKWKDWLTEIGHISDEVLDNPSPQELPAATEPAEEFVPARPPAE